jgi:F0F1-type ATP synthase membrane subunit a
MPSNLEAMMEAQKETVADLVRENANSQPDKTTLIMCLLAIIAFFMTIAKLVCLIRRKYKEYCYGN